MTIKIQATRLPAGTDPNAVAGATAGDLHELTGKLHETVRGRGREIERGFVSKLPLAADASDADDDRNKKNSLTLSYPLFTGVRLRN